jgi:hypothetical protein
MLVNQPETRVRQSTAAGKPLKNLIAKTMSKETPRKGVLRKSFGIAWKDRTTWEIMLSPTWFLHWLLVLNADIYPFFDYQLWNMGASKIPEIRGRMGRANHHWKGTSAKLDEVEHRLELSRGKLQEWASKLGRWS